MEVDFSKQLFRCSSLGYIMTDPKGKSFKQQYNDAVASQDKKIDAARETKNKATQTYFKLLDSIDELKIKIERLKPLVDIPNISDTTKTHLADIYTRVVFGRKTEDLKSKYLEKGLMMEEDAITMYALITCQNFKKNKRRQYNDYIEGELDFSDDDCVYDTKVNWSIFQFNRVASRPIKPLYEWQMQGYMWLFNKPKAQVLYALLDTPEHLIKREETKLMYDLFGSPMNYDYASQDEKDDYAEACKELRHNHIYGDIDIKERVRPYPIARDDEKIERIKTRVEECRLYLTNFSNNKNIDYGTDGEEEMAA